MLCARKEYTDQSFNRGVIISQSDCIMFQGLFFNEISDVVPDPENPVLRFNLGELERLIRSRQDEGQAILGKRFAP